jgi:RNA polymerase sigma factor (sigma-70 family)
MPSFPDSEPDALERWLVELEAGRHETAWDAFIDRYRGLVFAAIRHYVRDPDDVMDVYTWVCEGLRKDGFRRLRRYAAEPEHRARFSTWLVAVVRHLAVDWLRKRDGRPRPEAIDSMLTPLQRRIHEEVFTRGRSHAEAYELVRSRDQRELTFGGFLRELTEVYRAVTRGRGRLARELRAPAPPDPAAGLEMLASGDARRVLESLLGSLPPTDRVAIQMYVIDEVAAADIARVLGLPNAKAVYNRVYRALDAMRSELEQAGLGPEDL